MAFEHHEYDLLSVLAAEAIGEPGNRRFRLIAGTEGDMIVLWMEKGQLQVLGLAIEELLEQLSRAGLASANLKGEPLPVPIPPPTAPEYSVARMAIGYDEERKLMAILAHELEQAEGDEPIFAGRADLRQAKSLAEQIATVIAAGRPRCPRCGELIGPEGHVCVHSNGHLPWNPEVEG